MPRRVIDLRPLPNNLADVGVSDLRSPAQKQQRRYAEDP
jgi:hypothetical protein